MSADVGAPLSGDYAACEAALRGGGDADRDAWLASLFIPQPARAHVQALYAFSREIARVPEIVSQPTLGEIRMQWWVEALEGARAAEASSNPVAAALLDTVSRFDLPAPALVALVDARRFDLYADPMPSLNDLEGYCGETRGKPDAARLDRRRWRARSGRRRCRRPRGRGARHRAHPCRPAGPRRARPVLHSRRRSRASRRPAAGRRRRADLARAGGGARGDAGRSRRHATRRPRAAAAQRWSRAPARRSCPSRSWSRLLRTMEKRGFDPFRDRASPPQWRRQWALWRAARTL